MRCKDTDKIGRTQDATTARFGRTQDDFVDLLYVPLPTRCAVGAKRCQVVKWSAERTPVKSRGQIYRKYACVGLGDNVAHSRRENMLAYVVRERFRPLKTSMVLLSAIIVHDCGRDAKRQTEENTIRRGPPPLLPY